MANENITIGQYRYKITGSDNLNNTTSLVFENKSWVKLGIQAPPGTQWEINSKQILIGRTGIYELDDDIEINTLKLLSEIDKAHDIIIDFAYNEAEGGNN